MSDSVLGMAEERISTDLRQDHQVSFSRTNAARVVDLQGVAAEYAPSTPEVVVLSAGTNDVYGRLSPSTTISQLQTMRAKFPHSCVTFVTLNTHTVDTDVNNRSAQVNAWIRAQSRVADWDTFVDGYYAGGSPYGNIFYDLIHVTPLGELFLNSVVTEAVRLCRNRGLPFGSLDVASSTTSGEVRVAGWALDPDTTSSIAVHVYADSTFLGARSADLSRPDVAGFGYGTSHGFDSTFTGVPPGSRDICVFGINTGTNGSANSLIGCRRITVQS